MDKELKEYWVTKRYKDAYDRDFEFIMGQSEVSMENALYSSLGETNINQLEIEKVSPDEWICTTLDKSIVFHVVRRDGKPLPPPHPNYSYFDNRLTNHKIGLKPIQKNLF